MHHASAIDKALAAHRFGLGQAQSADAGPDVQGWLLAQLGPAGPQVGNQLVGAAEGVRRYTEFVRQRLTQRTASANPPGMAGGSAADTSVERQFVDHFRNIVQADVRAHLATAALSPKPFNERLALFWANHFTVSMAKPTVRGMVGAFEREAIRPHMAGSFEALLNAAVKHATMLRYLDNDNSAGPQSRMVQRSLQRAQGTAGRPPRITGLNENLAREVLELHTLGATSAADGGAAYGGWGGYTQADVTAFAGVLTGWRVPVATLLNNPSATEASIFDPAWHQPGPKTIMGKRYPEGPEALAQVLHDLSQHPSTARYLSYKLARHFVADQPPPALVAKIEHAYQQSQGDLAALARALVMAPEAWSPTPSKLKTPAEFVISTARLLQWDASVFERFADFGLAQMGQRIQAAPSPAGFSDRADDWLGPEAIWKRVEWAQRVAERNGQRIDARALARNSLGPLLQPETARQIERAADGPQALALLLMAPEFQRR